MDKILSEWNPATTEAEIIHEDNETLAFEHRQDISPILEANVRQFNDAQTLHKRNEEFRHIGRIPLLLLLKFRNEEGLDFLDSDDAKKIIKKLNDPEYRKLKTHPGRV